MTLQLTFMELYKLLVSGNIWGSQSNQVDNQTWFDATLVERFNECNQEVTIHWPNVLTLQSSAFTRGYLIVAARDPMKKKLYLLGYIY